MKKFEIWFVERSGDAFFTGDWFYDYDVALDEIIDLNITACEANLENDPVYIIKTVEVKRV